MPRDAHVIDADRIGVELARDGERHWPLYDPIPPRSRERERAELAGERRLRLAVDRH